ncbi:MAG: PfkB family carbohydrate kinase [Verrucomicrobiota bacterium]
MDILGLGMSLMDTIHLVDEFPRECGVTEVRDSITMGGGPVPTALCAASRLGAATSMIDRVGDDWRSDLIVRDYEEYGVDLSLFSQESGRISSLGIILVRKTDGERHIIFQQGDATPLSAQELPIQALKQCRILHLNGRHWPACLEAAKMVRSAGGVVSFDGGANRFDPKLKDLLPFVDVLIVARDFAEKLYGSNEHEIQLSALANDGAGIVGITDGMRGSWFRSSDGASFHQPAFEIEGVVDSTGCGDVFHGAFLWALNRGEIWEKCAEFASAAAALNATGLGGRGHIPSALEVRRLISS